LNSSSNFDQDFLEIGQLLPVDASASNILKLTIVRKPSKNEDEEDKDEKAKTDLDPEL